MVVPSLWSGRLAQLGERRVRNAEAEGSNPLPSTHISHLPHQRWAFSSVVERLLHTQEVAGSIPATPIPFLPLAIGGHAHAFPASGEASVSYVRYT
jgi:hypothetical protein